MKWIKQRENQIFFSVTLIAIAIAIAPLVSKYCLLGHDSEYHLLRIEALKSQILMGKPFTKVNPFYFGGMGYANSLFYPDFLIYIPAFLRVIGFSIKDSYHLFLITCIVLCYAVSYYCGKKITGNRFASILFAVILTLSSYHLDDIHVRAAAGEYTAFIFIPVVMYGIYNMLYEDMSRPWILGLGMGLVLLCHTLSFVMCMVTLILMLIFNFDVVLRRPKLILKLIVTGIVTLLVTASYWMPMVEQFSSDVFYVSTPWIEPAQEAVKVTSMFGLAFPTLGLSLMVLLLPRVILFRNEDDSVMKFSDQCISAGIILAFLATDIMPWDKFGKYFSVVQFPWRIYVISSVLLSFGAAIVVYRLAGALCFKATDAPKEYDEEDRIIGDDNKINRYGVVLALTLAILSVATAYNYSMNSREYYDYSNDYYDYKPFTASVIAGEWLPMSVTDPSVLVDMSEKATNSNGEKVEFTRDKGNVALIVDSECEYVDVPVIYYKGYKAEFSDGRQAYIDGSGENGTLRLYTLNNTGAIIVSYGGTGIQKLAGFISLVSIVTIAVYIFFTNKKKKIQTT